MNQADGGVSIVMRHTRIKDGALNMVDTMDPSGAGRLQRIEETLDRLLNQNISILEGLSLLYLQGGERLDKIEATLNRLFEDDEE